MALCYCKKRRQCPQSTIIDPCLTSQKLASTLNNASISIVALCPCLFCIFGFLPNLNETTVSQISRCVLQFKLWAYLMVMTIRQLPNTKYKMRVALKICSKTRLKFLKSYFVSRVNFDLKFLNYKILKSRKSQKSEKCNNNLFDWIFLKQKITSFQFILWKNSR